MLIHYTEKDPFAELEAIRAKRPTAKRLQEIHNSPTPPKRMRTLCEDIVILETAGTISRDEYRALIKQTTPWPPEVREINPEQTLILCGSSGYGSYRRNKDGSLRPMTSCRNYQDVLVSDLRDCEPDREPNRQPVFIIVERTLEREVNRLANTCLCCK